MSEELKITLKEAIITIVIGYCLVICIMSMKLLEQNIPEQINIIENQEDIAVVKNEENKILAIENIDGAGIIKYVCIEGYVYIDINTDTSQISFMPLKRKFSNVTFNHEEHVTCRNFW